MPARTIQSPGVMPLVVYSSNLFSFLEKLFILACLKVPVVLGFTF